MNRAFSEATTSIAFSLTLTKRQCNSILRVAEAFDSEGDQGSWDWFSRQGHRLIVVGVEGLNPLAAKGLVYWKYDDQGRANSFGGLTDAGKLVVQLLKEAGLTIENTNYGLTLKRLGAVGGAQNEKEAA